MRSWEPPQVIQTEIPTERPTLSCTIQKDLLQRAAASDSRTATPPQQNHRALWLAHILPAHHLAALPVLSLGCQGWWEPPGHPTVTAGGPCSPRPECQHQWPHGLFLHQKHWHRDAKHGWQTSKSLTAHLMHGSTESSNPNADKRDFLLSCKEQPRAMALGPSGTG